MNFQRIYTMSETHRHTSPTFLHHVYFNICIKLAYIFIFPSFQQLLYNNVLGTTFFFFFYNELQKEICSRLLRRMPDQQRRFYNWLESVAASLDGFVIFIQF